MVILFSSDFSGNHATKIIISSASLLKSCTCYLTWVEVRSSKLGENHHQKSSSDAIKLTVDLWHSGWSFQPGHCNNCKLWRDSEFTLGDKYYINCDRLNMRILGLTFDIKTWVLDPHFTLVQWYVAFLFDEYTGSIH